MLIEECPTFVDRRDVTRENLEFPTVSSGMSSRNLSSQLVLIEEVRRSDT